MVREQEPSKAPPAPAKPDPISPAAEQGERKTVTKPAASHEPQFGHASPLRALNRPFSNGPLYTPPGAPASLPSSDQSLYYPALNQSFHPPPLRPSIHLAPSTHAKSVDQYSNLFIPSRKPVKPAANPLLQARNTMEDQRQPRSSVPSSDDDFVGIPRPTNPPAFAARPAKSPMFSSQTILPKPVDNFVDLTADTIGMASTSDLFHDRYGAADPQIYMDSGKATDDIKALLEGAFEDEDDRPRTRQKKKQAQDDLVARLEELKVNGAEKEAEPTKEDEADEDDGYVEGLKVRLLPHQVEGVSWMRDKELGTKKTRGVFPKGGILADDMGLGKTIQSIALILTNQKPPAPNTSGAENPDNRRKLPANLDKGTLVVAPLALIKQWEGEIRDRVEDTHTLRVCVHHGPQRAKGSKELKKYDVVITTYHTLVSEHGSSGGNLKVGCFGINWYRVILDEAHSIKNRNAKATKAACALDAEYRWCLTGTPMQNNLDELQSLIHFMRIKPYENLNNWRDQITRPMNNGRGGLAIKRLQVYLKAFMKRRTKDILKQEGALRAGGPVNDGDKANGFKIVKRTVEKIEVEFTPQERGFYDRLESRTDKSLELMMAGNKMSYASALVLLLRLRQACNHANLIKGDLAKEKDAFVDSSSSQTISRKKAVKDDDLDSMAAMLGGLSVATKRCDVCQIELSCQQSASGAIRCSECEADLKDDNSGGRNPRERKRKKKNEKFSKHGQMQEKARRKPRRHVITDSDDDEQDEKEQEPVISISDEEDQEPEAESDERSSTGDEDDEDDEDLSSDNNDAPSPIISTKIRHLLQILNRDSAEHKYIIFSFFTSMLDLIEPFLRQEGLTFTRYDGQMKNDLREASLERLKTHNKTRILLCSLRAGSLGLNLTAASRVVILEPFWNPFVEEQAIDRVHRLNQIQDVVVYKMTIKNTVEERILDLQDKKRQLADATIEGKTAAAKLTMEDMLKLFRHDAEHTHQVDGIGLDLMARDRVLMENGNSRRDLHLSREQTKPEHAVYGRRW